MNADQARKVLAECEYDPAKGTRHYAEPQRQVVKEAVHVLEAERVEQDRQAKARAHKEQLQRLAAITARPIPTPGEEG